MVLKTKQFNTCEGAISWVNDKIDLGEMRREDLVSVAADSYLLNTARYISNHFNVVYWSDKDDSY